MNNRKFLTAAALAAFWAGPAKADIVPTLAYSEISCTEADRHRTADGLGELPLPRTSDAYCVTRQNAENPLTCPTDTVAYGTKISYWADQTTNGPSRDPKYVSFQLCVSRSGPYAFGKQYELLPASSDDYEGQSGDYIARLLRAWDLENPPPTQAGQQAAVDQLAARRRAFESQARTSLDACGNGGTSCPRERSAKRAVAALKIACYSRWPATAKLDELDHALSNIKVRVNDVANSAYSADAYGVCSWPEKR